MRNPLVRPGTQAMKAKRKIKARTLVLDIRNSLSDAELMEKHRLTASGLQSIFRKLVKAGAVSGPELASRSTPYDDTADLEAMREADRHYPALALTVHEPHDAVHKGIVHDISSKGLAVRGLSAQVDDVKKLVVSAEELPTEDSVVLEASCRWVMRDRLNIPIAGFEITVISDRNAEVLQTWIQDLTFVFSE